MDFIVLVAVLAGAALHAGWNVIVKVGLDRFSSVLLLSLVHGLLAVLLLPFFSFPAAAAWPWLIASAFLHTGYKIFLVQAYEHGDLSQVYPLARGSAPLLVAIFGALVLGETMTASNALAVMAIAFGVVLMSAKGGASFGALPPKALLFALVTAGFTASYTIVDGIGARHSGTASGFTLWMFLLDTLGMIAYALITRGRGIFVSLIPAWRSGLAAGAMSLGSYWIAIWAFTMAPIALVAAMRETSVLFAMLMALLLLREPAGRWRWAAATLIVCGIVLMRI
jgi:drug/metabolite transporter (DMT)-like permease